jgi:hypothetical protein
MNFKVLVFLINMFHGMAQLQMFGTVFGGTLDLGKRIGERMGKRMSKRMEKNLVVLRNLVKRTKVQAPAQVPAHATTDHNFKKQFARSKLARGSALSKNCNSRCSVKTPCNKRCQLARDRYQLSLAQAKYKKDNVQKYTSTQLNQRYYSGQVAKESCNSRCQAAKAKYQKQRTQYMKTFQEPCQNGHIKNTGTLNGKPLSDQGNPSGNTPGDKTTVGGYGGVAKGRPLGAPGAGQINWSNSAKYNWRTACKSYSKVLVGPATSRPSKNRN